LFEDSGMKIKSRLAPAFYCSYNGYFTSCPGQQAGQQPEQQQEQMLPPVQQREQQQEQQQEQQEQRFQPIFGRKQTMPEPAERQQARYVSFWFPWKNVSG
jgi:hypothetical protein